MRPSRSIALLGLLGLFGCRPTPLAEPVAEAAARPTEEARPVPQTRSEWRPKEPGQCPSVEPDRRSLRFGTTLPLICPRRNTCRANPKLRGARSEEIYAYLGPPLRCAGARWTYRLNGDCETEHDLLHLTVNEGVVTQVEHEHRFPEAECVAGG